MADERRTSFAVSTVGLIRACVGRSDGTSDLILQGIHRVKFSEFEQEAPFPIARIKPLETRTNLSVETDALAAKVLEFYAQLRNSGRELPEKIDRYLSEMSDPEMLADLIASTFVSDTSPPPTDFSRSSTSTSASASSSSTFATKAPNESGTHQPRVFLEQIPIGHSRDVIAHRPVQPFALDPARGASPSRSGSRR